ncbi:TetR/AcrR family transcriptional regulator [Nocardiopsis sp. CNT-189]|uniref:TetR/AcrR family transcriptional regulator n=1 Tax=Nocardiopsis oceanisediminis TaxID=2816862 RepID=UPI003B2C66CB
MPEAPPPHGSKSKAARRNSAEASSGQREIKKIRLQQSVLELLKQGAGIHGVTMAQIAGALGIDKSSVYHYYASKEDLFREALGNHLDAHMARVDLALGPGEDFAGYTSRLVAEMVALWRSSGPLLLASASLAATDAAQHAWEQQRIRGWSHALEAAARTAADRGEIALPPDVPMAAAAAMWGAWGGCSASIGHLEAYPPEQREAIVERLQAVMVDSVRRALGWRG